MRIRRKIAFGYLILIVLLLLVQIYQLALAERMLKANRQFSLVDFNASEETIALNEARIRLKDFLDKYLITKDSRYGLEVEERMQVLDRQVKGLAQYDLGPGLKEELRLLRQHWANLSPVIHSVVKAYREDP